MQNILFERAKEIGESFKMNIDQAGKMKSKMRREVKTRIKKMIQQRLADGLKDKTKAGNIQGQMPNERIYKKWQHMI